MALVGFGISIREKKAAFFDRPAVIAMMSERVRSRLNRFGAYVRLTARRSMRDRKGPSAPGTPPNAHGQRWLKTGILYNYDAETKSVVIGPTKHGSEQAPELNEFGGAIVRLRRGKARTCQYPPRPFMRPAFEKAKQNLAAIWGNSVR